MKKVTLKNIIWKEGKYYVGQCLDFDVSSFGRTRMSALKNLKEATALYLEDIPKAKVIKTFSPQVFETIFQFA